VRDRGEVFRLSNGTFHVCYGVNCADAVVDRESQLVCSKTGLVVGSEQHKESDPSWTGRSVGSANPDDSAGVPQGGWLRRRDQFAASVAAFRNASAISDDQVVCTNAPKGRTSQKRGAVCVDQEAPEKPKDRPLKREGFTRDAIEKLAQEAMGVVGALLIVDGRAGAGAPKPDARLQNPKFVSEVAMRRYVRGCASGSERFCLEGVHNVLIAANEFVRKQRAAAADAADAAARPRRGAAFSGQVRKAVSELIVTLWRAASATPHMNAGKKGTDSFRPFAAGILYSLKRGLHLKNGLCIVPAIEALSSHLPALRSSQSTPASRQLQSSSHRGICGFHRSISSLESVPDEEAEPARRLFSDAARQAAYLVELVRCADKN